MTATPTNQVYPKEFEDWYKKLAVWEGGLADRPKDDDKGGLTMRGITIATWKRVATPLLGLPPTEGNLRNLTAPQAKFIAFKEYWESRGVNQALPEYRTLVADSLFLGGGVPSLGYANISALNKAKPTISQIATNRLNYLKKIPSWKANGKGWTNRLQDMAGKAVKLSGENLGMSVILLFIVATILFLTLKK